MKHIFLSAAFALIISAVLANGGNNNSSTDSNSKEIEVVKQEGAANPYSASLETQIPGCHGPKHPEMVCTAQYSPVCGCDGQTYSNACVATREGILVYTPGECGSPTSLPLDCYDPTQATPTAPCFKIYRPVCACGILTFANECEARRFGFINTTEGACTTPLNGQ